MRLLNPRAEVFVPDGKPVEEALARTTHLAVAAHPDDAEIMGYAGILECFQRKDLWFTSVVVTDGAGSPRTGPYAHFTNEEMVEVRKAEVKKAATLGEYGAVVLLQYTSAQTKDPRQREVVEDLKTVLAMARPRVVYSHNLADKHDTHVATLLRLLQALQELPEEGRPQRLYGCEVWRDLDWMVDSDKVAMDVSGRENLAAALLGVYDSQITGGKRYDLATLGRWRANATYWESHGVDVAERLLFAMDLTPLLQDPNLNVLAFVQQFVQRFAQDIAARLKRVGLEG